MVNCRFQVCAQSVRLRERETGESCACTVFVLCGKISPPAFEEIAIRLGLDEIRCFLLRNLKEQGGRISGAERVERKGESESVSRRLFLFSFVLFAEYGSYLPLQLRKLYLRMV